MSSLHEEFMYEIEEIRAEVGYIDNDIEFIDEPDFEYDIAANTIFIFKEYSNREIILKINFIPKLKIYAISITEFALDDRYKARNQSGFFTMSGEQLDSIFKDKHMSSYLVKIVNEEDSRIKSSYNNLIENAIQFYYDVFPQWQ